MLYAPEWTANFSADYTFYVNDFTITPHLNYAYVGSQWDYPGYSAPSINTIAGHSLLSGLITVEYDRYEIELYGDNLTNTRYVSGVNNTNEIYGSPLEFGLRARTTF